jgi:hypothetical protein
MPASLMLILRPKKVGCRPTRDRVQLQNQIVCLLEMRIKLSIVVSNLPGAKAIFVFCGLG